LLVGAAEELDIDADVREVPPALVQLHGLLIQ
jgi:hypothetical protein